MCTFDTVKFNVRRGGWASSLSSAWEASEGVRRETIGGEIRERSWRCVQHPASGLRLFGSLEGPRSVEVSLPRLVHGTNAVLLKPGEVPAASARLVALVSEASEGGLVADPTRIDLADHLQVDPLDAIAALRGVKHPGVRSLPVEYPGTGLAWVGRELVVRLYDKGAEQGSPGGPMRLEVQLRGSKCPPVWDGQVIDSVMGFRTYRKQVLQLVARPLSKPSRLVEFLALGEREGWRAGSESALQLYCRTQCKNSKYRERLERGVRRQVVPGWLLDLRSRYPETGEFPPLLDGLPVLGAGAVQVA